MTKIIKNKIGLGTAAIGRPSYINIKDSDAESYASKETFRHKGTQILETAYNEGVRYFDTAPGYGIAEQMLIDWIKEKDDSSIEIATKWGYTYVADFDLLAIEHEVKEHSLSKLNEQWNNSMELLPSVTSYQIHSATFETGVLDNVAVLNRLSELKERYGLHIGLTTTGAKQSEVLERALDVEVNGEELFSIFQVTYNIFDQSIASTAREISNRNHRLIIKEALANGRVFTNAKYPHYNNAYKQLERLAKEYNVGMDAIALRFCIDSIPLYKVLSGASSEQHIMDNLKACDILLKEADLKLLTELNIEPNQYWTERKQLGWN